MDNSLYYIELCKNPIRFDSVSSLTNVFFDDSNKQIFAVRSGGATGVVVKGPTEQNVISFCMDDKGVVRSIKFSPDNRILAVQRKENSVEFICFNDGQPQPPNESLITYNAKSSIIFGFVWVHNKEVAIISNSGVEIFTINPEKKQIKSVKSISMIIKWFAWCSNGNLALLACDANILNPVIIKQKSITKLTKLELGTSTREIPERDVTLGQIYGTLAVLILQATNRLLEVHVYLLNGPGLAPQKSHVLKLGHGGRFAINIVDNLIVVHHQASNTSLLFDISLNGENINNIIYHSPVTSPRTIKPFSLKMPSLCPDGQMMNCELYSTNWVLFQPNIVIDAKLGCMWYLSLQIESLCNLITDRVHLVEFLLQRTNGKSILLRVLKQLVDDQYNGTILPILENIFDRINKVYSNWIKIENQTQNSRISATLKIIPKLPSPPKVLIDQSEVYGHVFSQITERPYTEKILMLYLQSLNKYNIPVQEDMTKLIVAELIRMKNYTTLQKLVEYSLILESKALACYLLSHSNVHPIVTQTALDMLNKINADEIILEVLLGQGKVVDALRIANLVNLSITSGSDIVQVSARKYLEAALRTKDPLIFYAVFKYFQQRNVHLRGSAEFSNKEQCGEFVEHFKKQFCITNQQQQI